MIKVTIHNQKLGQKGTRVFLPQATDMIRSLKLENDTDLYLSHDLPLKIEDYGFAEVENKTVITVQSEEKLTENQIEYLIGRLLALMDLAFFAYEWGDKRFEFSVFTIVTVP